MTECIAMLRDAASEFPSEAQVLVRLGYALRLQGWEKHGARCYNTESSDYAYEDTEYHSGNKYWREAVEIFERVLGMELGTDDRETVVSLSLDLYSKMGMYDKARSLCEKQASVRICREVLLPQTAIAEESDRYRGEAIIAVLRQLDELVTDTVLRKLSLATSEIGLEKLRSIIGMYETVFDDGRYGSCHSELCQLYMLCAVSEARLRENEGSDDFQTALRYFDCAVGHDKAYRTLAGSGKYRFTAPLVSQVEEVFGENEEDGADDFIKAYIDMMPEEAYKTIAADERYTRYFE